MSNDNKPAPVPATPVKDPLDDKQITLRLSYATVKGIIQFLGNAPFNQVGPLLADIHRQTVAQIPAPATTGNRQQRRATKAGKK